MDPIQAIEAAGQRWDPLKHTFYTRWAAGELSREELADYAGQYRHAVVALADASDDAARRAPDPVRSGLEAHAREERAHVNLWDGFASELDVPASVEASAETAACASVWADESRSYHATLAALLAIEGSQPPIAATKRDGLVAWYGVEEGSRGTAYFDLHEGRDVEHARELRELVAASASPDEAEALGAEAERVLKGYWTLLDGVEARHS